MTGIKRRHQAWPPCVIQLADLCVGCERESVGREGLRGVGSSALIEPSPSVAARPSVADL